MSKTTAKIVGPLLAVLSPFALANEYYLDGSIGQADADVGPYDTDDTFIRIGGGMNVNEYLDVEGGYWDFGSSRDGGVRVAADALYVAGKAGTEIGNGLNLYGRLGLLRWEADVGRFDDDGFDLILGGGIDFELGPGRMGFEAHFSELDDVDIRTLGVSYQLPLKF